MIYVVTRGRYSDYHIIAASADYKTAKKIKKKFDKYGWDECVIEEFPDAEAMLKNVWRVYFRLNGDVFICYEADSEYDYRDVGTIIDTTFKHDYDLIITVEADTKQDAIKIAAEKRAEYLATKTGL